LPPARGALAFAAIRSTQWPIRRLGPYSCVVAFVLLGAVALGISRVLLIAWQWERVSVTNSVFWMLVQGLRSDLMTLGIFAAPAVLVLPVLLAIGRISWWVRVCCVWLGLSLIAILFLELATPRFLTEFDSRPNRLFLEYLVYPNEVLAMLWNGYRGPLLLTVCAIAGLAWLIARHFMGYARAPHRWRASTVLLLWPMVLIVLFVMVRSSLQHRPANLATFAFCSDAMVNSLVANSTFTVLTAAYGLTHESESSSMYGEMSSVMPCAAGLAIRFFSAWSLGT
jgi:phosphoglycerol transferase MdoB-like AlkP superfamily enzyme